MPFRQRKPLTNSSKKRLKRIIITQEGLPKDCIFSRTVLNTLRERPKDPEAASSVLRELKGLRRLNKSIRGVPWSAAAERGRRRYFFPQIN